MKRMKEILDKKDSLKKMQSLTQAIEYINEEE